jgi:ribosome assembly protein 1
VALVLPKSLLIYKTDMAPPKTPSAPRGTIKGTAAHDLINFTIRAVPLPQDILHFILDNIVTLKKLQQEQNTDGVMSMEDADGIQDEE